MSVLDSEIDRKRARGHGAAGTERAEYLQSVCQLLWPQPAQAKVTRAGRQRRANGPPLAHENQSAPASTTSLIVLPSNREPRLLVPSERLPAAAAVARFGGSGSLPWRVLKRVMRVAMASNTGSHLFRDRLLIEAPPGSVTIGTYLQQVLGRELYVSLSVTGARANRKPVLQLLTPNGEIIGFAKIGVDPLTRELVRVEADALARLEAARPRSFAAPRALHRGSWNDLEVLVLTPLPARLRTRSMPSLRLLEVMREVAELAGLVRQQVAVAEHWQRLLERLLSAPDGPEREAMTTALARLSEQDGETALSYGSWHGDFSPWNMACTHGQLWVWDWERFAPGVPLGFDALHNWLQTEIRARHRDPVAAASGLLDRAPTLLADFAVPMSEARLTALLYLAELAVRNLADRQEEAGAQLGNPGWWLVPAISQELGR